MKYYNRFQMSTDWEMLKLGIGAGCTILVVLFVLVMDITLTSIDVKVTISRRKGDSDETMTSHVTVMDDVTILGKGINDAKSVLKRSNEKGKKI